LSAPGEGTDWTFRTIRTPKSSTPTFSEVGAPHVPALVEFLTGLTYVRTSEVDASHGRSHPMKPSVKRQGDLPPTDLSVSHAD
jgi:hypothetical protein